MAEATQDAVSTQDIRIGDVVLIHDDRDGHDREAVLAYSAAGIWVSLLVAFVVSLVL